ncbi:MAG: hypothetical protein ABIF19_07670 [Planctomycetota bacterium]
MGKREMIGIIAGLIVGTAFSAGCLWAGMRLCRIKGTFLAMVIIAAVSSLAALIPVVGWLASLIVMFVLICKWTDANLWPHAVLMVLVANLLGLLISGYISNIHL